MNATQLDVQQGQIDTVLSDSEETKETEVTFVEDASTVYRRVNWVEVSDNVSPSPMIIQNAQLQIEGPTNVNISSPEALFTAIFDEAMWTLLEEQSNLYLSQMLEAKKKNIYNLTLT